MILKITSQNNLSVFAQLMQLDLYELGIFNVTGNFSKITCHIKIMIYTFSTFNSNNIRTWR